MKVILVHQRHGLTRTYVITGWLKGLLSLCLLVAPVALTYLGYQLSVQVQSGDPVVAQSLSNNGTSADDHATATLDMLERAATSAESGQAQEQSPVLVSVAETAFLHGTASDADSPAAPDLLAESAHAARLHLARHLVSATGWRPSAVPAAAYVHGRIVDAASYLVYNHR